MLCAKESFWRALGVEMLGQQNLNVFVCIFLIFCYPMILFYIFDISGGHLLSTDGDLEGNLGALWDQSRVMLSTVCPF